MAKRFKKEKLGEWLQAIYDVLLAAYGPQTCTLDHSNPLELLVATILSAQCTDVRVNKVTPELFAAYPDAQAYANADPEELSAHIRSAGFHQTKSRSIIGACQKLVAEYDAKVPADMESLTSLPGIGRKTANVVLGDAFDVPGFPVDTHVKRLLNRMGCVSTDNPEKIEAIVNARVPDKYWANFSHLLIIHGRTRCSARKPDCPNCEVLGFCDFGRKAAG